MSMPHASPSLPPITPIGYYFETNSDVAGETNFLVGVFLLVITLISLAHNTKGNEILPLPVLMFTSFLMLLILRLVNKGREVKFITNESNRRNYLSRFTYRVATSTGILIVALFATLLYTQHWVSMITVAGLLGLANWNIKSPDRDQPFTGTNNISNYWKRITGKAIFSQLDYGSGDTLRFSYEDGLTRDSNKQYNVFFNRIQECCYDLANDSNFTWEREVLWSAHQQVSPDQLSKGLTFSLAGVTEENITPSFYRILYWEVILQEGTSSFQERFLLGVKHYATLKQKRLSALK